MPRERYRPPDLGYFARRSPGAAYWLGFLMADGCVTERELIVMLQRRDEDHLRSLLRALNCADRPLASANRGKASALRLGSVALARQLAALGVVTGRAGSTIGVADWLAVSPHFWRGVVERRWVDQVPPVSAHPIPRGRGSTGTDGAARELPRVHNRRRAAGHNVSPFSEPAGSHGEGGGPSRTGSPPRALPHRWRRLAPQAPSSPRGHGVEAQRSQSLPLGALGRR